MIVLKIMKYRYWIIRDYKLFQSLKFSLDENYWWLFSFTKVVNMNKRLGNYKKNTLSSMLTLHMY